MNERIARLRDRTLKGIPRISIERARIITRFYQSEEARGMPVPVARASAFKRLMSEKSLYLGEDELIVGERGPEPHAVPTYPEICVHSMEDFHILDSRAKIPYKVPAEDRAIHEREILPFWKGRSQRERIFSAMTDEWKQAYEAGIYTEFQEQRGPGHTVCGKKIYRLGMLDLKNDIRRAKAELDDFTDPQAQDKREELDAMDIAADALIVLAQRYADLLEKAAAAEKNPARKDELAQMAKICRRVPASPPETFWEALQYYWFVHVGVISEINPWDSFNPGRLDQHLWPFYQRDLAAGRITEEKARELLGAFWVKFHNHPAPPKVGVTAAESGTYTDFALINVGGVDAQGNDAVNDMSYMILDVVQEMRMVQPSSMAQVSKKNPDKFVRRVLRVVRTGFGQPSIFNTDAIVQELTRQGKRIEDAREGGASGCVEAGAFGREAYILTGYMNLPKILELTLHDGVDPRTGRRLGPATGNADQFQTFDDLLGAFEKQVRHFCDIKVRGNNVIERLFAKYAPVPFLSLLIDDCIAKGMDYHAGGARYNTSYIQGVGIGTLTDSLSFIKWNVFEGQRLTLPALVKALDANFKGHDEVRRLALEETPKYGNDDDRADDLTRRAFDIYYNAVEGRPNVRGGEHHVDMLPTTCHVYFGSVTGALPDGRPAGEPVSEGISPVQGADHKGPTAVIRSAAKLDHLRTGGTLLNQKFTPSLLENDANLENVLHLVRSYFRMDGHHIQFNVVDADLLREAQKHPEQHRDLIVRVAGYSDYFINLSPALQNEIIHRTEHKDF